MAAPTPARAVVVTQIIRVGGERLARLPGFLPSTGWQIDKTRKHYLRYVSRAVAPGIERGARAHRVVMERLLGRPLREDEHVHHQDFDKLNCCPCNLILMPAAFNPSPARRDPYTGAFLSPAEYERRYGPTVEVRRVASDVPEWVVSEEDAS